MALGGHIIFCAYLTQFTALPAYREAGYHALREKYHPEGESMQAKSQLNPRAVNGSKNISYSFTTTRGGDPRLAYPPNEELLSFWLP